MASVSALKYFVVFFFHHGQTGTNLGYTHMTLEMSSFLSLFIKSKVLEVYHVPLHMTVVCPHGLATTARRHSKDGRLTRKLTFVLPQVHK